jgi:hypothetical protein
MPHVSSHTLLDTAKIRTELGYRQVMTGRAALQESVDYLLAHEMDRSAHPAYRDQFDYDAEDRLVKTYRQAIHAVASEAGRQIHDFMHPMPHPKKQGTGRDERGR